MTSPAGRHDDDVGIERQNVIEPGEGIEAKGDAEPLAFGDPPVDDAENLPAAFERGGEQRLASSFRRGLEHGDGVAALASDARGLKARRSEEHTSELQSPKELVCRL